MSKVGQDFESLIKIVKKIRAKCPWDQEQTFESLKPYLVEEVYEALQAIDDKDKARLEEELGDMLLHVIMLALMAKETKSFSIKDVINTITRKMIRRHPHVFGKIKVKTADEVLTRWAKIKQAEKREARGAQQGAKKHKSILESVPRALPALYRAEKVQKRAARFGFDWDHVAGAWEKVHEEMDEIHDLLKTKITSKSKIQNLKEEIGDLLFAITNVARKLDINAEEALQDANSKFMRRFTLIEKELNKRKMTLREMDALWDKIKAQERG